MDPVHVDDTLQDVSQLAPGPASEGLTPAPESPPAETPHNFVRIRRSHLYAVLVPLAFVTGLAVGFLFWGRAKTVPVTSPSVAETAGQESFVAAQAANCAAEQGDYWDYHGALMTGELGLGREAYTQYADLLGMDQMELLACIDSKRYAGEVEADARYAASLGVSGTPTFFINGIPLVGAQPLAQFSQIIDAELR